MKVTIFYQNLPHELAENLTTPQEWKKTFVVQDHWQLLPYLSLEENLLLGCPRKVRKNRQQLRELFQQLEILPEFELPIEDYDAFQQILFQIARALLQDRKRLVLDHVTSQLSVKEKQQLLHLCEKLGMEKNLEIILITRDPLLAAQ